MAAPALRVVTRPFKLTAELTEYLAEPSLAVIRRGDGLVGIGERLRLSASGENRVAELAAAWSELTAAAEIDDPVQLPGTGLTAFGSIAFGHSSSLESVLIVPEVLVGIRDGRGWITHFGDSSAEPMAQKFRSNRPVELLVGEQTEAAFKASVQDAVALIRQNQLEKVVLARDLTAEVPSDFDLRSVVKRLSIGYPDCWTYAVDGTFGASPELLVRVSHRQVATRVLAGTGHRFSDAAQQREASANLLDSAKDRSEHQLAVDSVIDSLRPLTNGIDVDETPFVVELPNLIHLASDVHAVLSDSATGLDLVAALHPTAAVAGTPRNVALELIHRFEPFDRGRFAGPVGWISANGDCEWAIALRGGQYEPGRVRVFAGCGVVADSDPNTELVETELKFRAVRSALD